jgi:hypothetical protein
VATSDDYYNAAEMGAPRGITAASVRSAVARARALSRTHPTGAWPKIGIPKPDQSRETGSDLYWLKARRDVQEWRAQKRLRFPELRDAGWLRRRAVDEAASTPAIAAEVGCSVALVRAAISVELTAQERGWREAALRARRRRDRDTVRAAAPAVPAPLDVLAAKRLSERREQAARAAAILAAGAYVPAGSDRPVRLAGRAEAAVRARVEYPDASVSELAALSGVPRGSLSVVLANVLRGRVPA